MTTRAFLGAAMLADTTPQSEVTSGTPGTQDKASRGNHRHPRLTSAVWGVTNASGEVTFNFTRVFTTKPTVDLSYEELADNQPCIFKVKSWLTNGNGEYTGLVAKGYRLQTLPSTILSLTALVSFSVSINAPAGINVSCIALQQS